VKEGRQKNQGNKKKLVAEDGLSTIRCQPLLFLFFFKKWKGKMERGTFLTVLSFSFCTLTSDLCIEKSICLLGCGTEGLYFS